MNLKVCIDVVKEHFPSLKSSKMQDTSGVLLENPAAIEASSGDKDTPTCAVLNAAQSFAPSPHIKVVNPSFLNASTNKALCSGAIRANTRPFFNTKRYD